LFVAGRPPLAELINHLYERGKLSIGETLSDGVQEVRKDRGDKITAFHNQLGNHVTDIQSSRLSLRWVQELGNKLDDEFQASLSAGCILPENKKLNTKHLARLHKVRSHSGDFSM
jgi:hypothetical protein